MEIVVFPDLSEVQKRRLPKDYVAPPVEGTYIINKKHPEGIIHIYVGKCDWESRFEFCLMELTLTVFHEVMHILCPDIGEFIPYAEKVLAETLGDSYHHKTQGYDGGGGGGGGGGTPAVCLRAM